MSPGAAGGWSLDLEVLEGPLAVCRLGAADPVPAWASAPGPLVSTTRTGDELSLVCPWGAVPGGVRREGPWRALKVAGPLDFAAVGILAALAAALAREGISLFALSTYDTDYLLVREPDLAAARAALVRAGHRLP